MRVAVAVVVGVTLFSSSRPSFAQDDRCVEIARIGLVDQFDRKVEYERAYALLYRLHNDSQISESNARTTTGNLGISLDGLLGSLGYGDSRSAFQNMRNATLEEIDERMRISFKDSIRVRQANATVAHLVDKCMQHDGLKLFVVHDESAPNQFQLAYDYSRRLAGSATVRVAYSSGIRCYQDNLGGHVLQRFTAANGAKAAFQCQRVDTANSAGQAITVQADQPLVFQDNGVLRLSPKPGRAACRPLSSSVTFAREAFTEQSGLGRGMAVPVGPYCGWASVRIDATAWETRNLLNVVPWASLSLRDNNAICGDKRSTGQSIRLDVKCEDLVLPPHTVRYYSSYVLDGAADLDSLKLLLTVSPRNGPAPNSRRTSPRRPVGLSQR